MWHHFFPIKSSTSNFNKTTTRAINLEAVNAGDVNHDVDHVGAELVGLHVDGVGVGGDVDLGDHVK